MLTREEAKKITDRALSFAATPDCSITLISAENASIRFALNGITTSGYQVQQELMITAIKDSRTGTTSITEFDDASLRTAMRNAAHLAEIGPPNPEVVEPLGPQKYADSENFDAPTASARNKEMIPGVRAVIDGARAKNFIAAGFFERSAASTTIANKRGLFGFQRATDARLSATVRNAAGTSSGWASQPTVRIGAIDGAKIAETAIGKCERWANPRRLEPGNYTVVLEPTAVSDLIGLMGFSFRARGAAEGRTWLSKKGGGTLLGEKVFPDSITLRSAPFDPRYSTSLWDGSNLPNTPVTWIDKGVVSNLWYDRYYALKSSKQPTPQPTNLLLDGEGTSLDNLIKGVDRGLLVTRFWYIRSVNPQTLQFTGITRDGLFLIEKGKVTAPVMNFRFNQSLVTLLKNVVASGTPERVQGGEGIGMIAPALVVKDFSFTAVSDAV